MRIFLQLVGALLAFGGLCLICWRWAMGEKPPTKGAR